MGQWHISSDLFSNSIYLHFFFIIIFDDNLADSYNSLVFYLNDLKGKIPVLPIHA